MNETSSGAPGAGASSDETPGTGAASGAVPAVGASGGAGAAPAASGTAEPSASAAAAAEPGQPLRESVVQAIKTCYDPEIPVDIYELGLIYEVAVDDANAVKVRMTLTSPMCPVAESLPGEVKDKIAKVPGVSDVDLELVWEPAWDPSLMSEAARLQLGF
jgi:FeS assembly SUF system protein